MRASIVMIAVLMTLAGSSVQSEVSIPASSRVVDFRGFNPDAWLRAGQLPTGGVLHWHLSKTGSSASTGCCVEGFSSSCGRYPEKQILQPELPQAPAPVGGQDETFSADQPGGPPAYATETQWFYQKPADAAAAFAVYAGVYDGCDQLDNGLQETEYRSPVTSRVRRTATGALAGAWLHLVRHPDGSPAYSEHVEDRYSDNHEYAVVYGNVLAILATDLNSPVLDDTARDAALVNLIGWQLASYDNPPRRAAFPPDPHLDLWQPWPSPARWPTTSAWAWGYDPQDGLGIPAEQAMVGQVACTPSPTIDLDLTGRVFRDYQQYPTGHTGRQWSGSRGRVDLFFFTSAKAAAAGNAALLADLRSCQARLRTAQTAAGISPPDAAVTPVTTSAGIAVWTIAATGLSYAYPGTIQPYRPTWHQDLVVLIVRGPLLEATDFNVGTDGASAFTPAADHAMATDAATNLCAYDTGC